MLVKLKYIFILLLSPVNFTSSNNDLDILYNLRELQAD